MFEVCVCPGLLEAYCGFTVSVLLICDSALGQMLTYIYLSVKQH